MKETSLAFVGIIALILIIILVIIVSKIFMKLYYRGLNYSYENQNTALFQRLSIISTVPILGTITYQKFVKEKMAERENLFSEVSLNPTNENVDRLIEYVNSVILGNAPVFWNKLRGVWFAINESPNVATYKKRDLRTILTTKGLRLVGKEMDIIDNYIG